MSSLSNENCITGPNSHYDEMEMKPHSECLPKSEPQYEVCEGGVTSSLEKNKVFELFS